MGKDVDDKMIYDKIENIGRYLGISRNLDQALLYMKNTDLSLLENGKHIIDEDKIFINVMQAMTDPDKKEYEFHEKYYDIQIDLVGTEDILFSTGYEEITRPYQEEGDIGMGICRCETRCHLSPGRFVICEPGEPHLPGVASGTEGEQIRKAVIKVHRGEE
ncbi:MAG: YhcH/YjgK/YiaL family protein [Lachnospiraceae bacterium]|nr:YhcH/YjgK/YiaL family protein [Lachnospiraceae bacterium]